MIAVGAGKALVPVAAESGSDLGDDEGDDE
jgi:hypothetical protein